ncbi:Cuticle protein AMP3 [Penaeus vannamei]|uniref:Cuticle protein AMP3 n=1 Tax=Penaeus vannamei TaxID=6689 RepID=A0A423T7C7_PENVA|nr:Cuticle protein AMP3 [Penaeus vannamei]
MQAYPPRLSGRPGGCLPDASEPPPRVRRPDPVDEREDRGDGNFRYRFETSNGIKTEKVGTPGSKGQSNMQGAFSFPFPEGGVAEFTYVADEFGYQPSSDLLPVPLPSPPTSTDSSRSPSSKGLRESPSRRNDSRRLPYLHRHRKNRKNHLCIT